MFIESSGPPTPNAGSPVANSPQSRGVPIQISPMVGTGVMQNLRKAELTHQPNTHSSIERFSFHEYYDVTGLIGATCVSDDDDCPNSAASSTDSAASSTPETPVRHVHFASVSPPPEEKSEADIQNELREIPLQSSVPVRMQEPVTGRATSSLIGRSSVRHQIPKVDIREQTASRDHLQNALHLLTAAHPTQSKIGSFFRFIFTLKQSDDRKNYVFNVLQSLDRAWRTATDKTTLKKTIRTLLLECTPAQLKLLNKNFNYLTAQGLRQALPERLGYLNAIWGAIGEDVREIYAATNRDTLPAPIEFSFERKHYNPIPHAHMLEAANALNNQRRISNIINLDNINDPLLSDLYQVTENGMCKAAEQNFARSQERESNYHFQSIPGNEINPYTLLVGPCNGNRLLAFVASQTVSSGVIHKLINALTLKQKYYTADGNQLFYSVPSEKDKNVNITISEGARKNNIQIRVVVKEFLTHAIVIDSKGNQTPFPLFPPQERTLSFQLEVELPNAKRSVVDSLFTDSAFPAASSASSAPQLPAMQRSPLALFNALKDSNLTLNQVVTFSPEFPIVRTMHIASPVSVVA